VITLTGETDLVSVAQLSVLVSAQLSGGTVTVEGPHELGSPYGGSIRLIAAGIGSVGEHHLLSAAMSAALASVPRVGRPAVPSPR
jgi:hypothetical protein